MTFLRVFMELLVLTQRRNLKIKFDKAVSPFLKNLTGRLCC